MNILGSIKFQKMIYQGNKYTALKHIVQHDGNDYEVIQYKKGKGSDGLDMFEFRGVLVDLQYNVTVTYEKPFTTVLLAVELVKFIRESKGDLLKL